MDVFCLLVEPAIPPTKSKYMKVEWNLLAPAGWKRSETSQFLAFGKFPLLEGGMSTECVKRCWLVQVRSCLQINGTMYFNYESSAVFSTDVGNNFHVDPLLVCLLIPSGYLTKPWKVTIFNR